MKTATILALLAGTSLAHAAGTPYSKQGAADLLGKVEISNVAGTVEITTWDRPEFAVDADLDEGIERVDVSSSPGVTTIRVVTKRKVRKLGEARLRVSLPAGSRIEVGAVSASISLKGDYRSAQLRSISGDVTVAGGGEQLEVRTVSGNAALTGGAGSGRFQLESISGSVIARDVSGELEASATSGNLAVSMPQAQRIRLRSISGNAQVEATLAPAASIETEVISGNIVSRLRAAEGFRFDLSSGSGPVRNCFHEGQKMGSTGAGNGNVRLRSGSGSVSLCDR